jgi:hypothetical protein
MVTYSKTIVISIINNCCIGTVTVEPSSRKSRGRVDIHLSCSFRVSADIINKMNRKQSIFKVMMSPIWIPDDENQSRFSLTIPSDLPAYNINDEVIYNYHKALFWC